MEQTNRDLSRAPDLVFLHNPERTLPGAPNEARSVLRAACAALGAAARERLCGAWGISSWDPRPLPALTDGTVPRPDVLMVRAGLVTGSHVLEASEALTARWCLGADQVWGMSPFGGSAMDPLWGKLDPRVFIQNTDNELLAVQAAFRVAYWLPRVGSIAVGTDNPAHLWELFDALRYEADPGSLATYRKLLRERSGRQPA